MCRYHELINCIFAKFYKRCRKYGAQHTIWQIKFNWKILSEKMIRSLEREDYDLEPLEVVRLKSKTVIAVWSILDKIVLKLVEKILSSNYENKISSYCTHVKSHGGLKYAVNDLSKVLPNYRFVFKTDVKKYYQSIDHHLLHTKLCSVIKNKFIRLKWQYLDRIEIVNGEHVQIKKGIAKGGILSPLLGAIFLEDLDQAMDRENVHYVRYMDDWVILTKTRGQLRKLVKLTHKIMKDLKLTLHPTKTFIGRISKGFDFLSYRFTSKGIRLALLTIQRYRSKLTWLYEQGVSKTRIEQYRQNWLRWVHAGGLKVLV